MTPRKAKPLSPELLGLIVDQLKPHAGLLFRADTGVYRNGRPNQIEIDASLVLQMATELLIEKRPATKRAKGKKGTRTT